MLVVDTNAGENALHEGLVAALGPGVVRRERLDVADVHIHAPGGRRMLVERKTWPDLVSSLRDGRYREQKLRLLAERERASEAGERVDLVYLIEGRYVALYTDKNAGTPNAQAHAALIKMAVRDGIAVVHSSSPEDSARLVHYMHATAHKGGAEGFDAEAKAASVAASGYAGACKFTNKRKNAEDAGFQMMLATINGVSGAKAAAVAERYPTAAALVGAYAGCGASEGDKLLADIDVGGKRLGPALSARIRAAFV